MMRANTQTTEEQKPIKYIVVSGGVISGIGKGVIGLNVTSIKIDPYLNIDAGTLTPLDHGEVFVLDDGGEVDLDLGNYERFLDVTLKKDNNITTGKIYQQRRGDYLGKTVQVVPHITDAIQDWVERVAQIPVSQSSDKRPDVCIIELGGTVGDIESAPFIEAMRQFQFRVGHDNFCLIHVSLIPLVGSVGEQKTKPTQASVRDLRGLGLSPDLIACRSSTKLEEGVAEKIAMFCHVPVANVLAVHDCKSVYHVPLLLRDQVLQKRLDLNPEMAKHDGAILLRKWQHLTTRIERLHDTVSIVLVGKYTSLKDSYISVVKSLEHAALSCSQAETQAAEPLKFHEAWRKLCSAGGILVPGGFGTRGIEGMILAAKHARENKIPYFGICLGMQIAVIEFARNVLGVSGATSQEFAGSESDDNVVVFMPEIDKTQMGGTMRLGSRATVMDAKKGEKCRVLYKNASIVHERHRHRYEINPAYVDRLQSAGLEFVGQDEAGVRMILMELKSHPYYVASQFHPEYKTRPLRPTPLFLGFVLASAGLWDEYIRNGNVEQKEGVLGKYPSKADLLEEMEGLSV